MLNETGMIPPETFFWFCYVETARDPPSQASSSGESSLNPMERAPPVLGPLVRRWLPAFDGIDGKFSNPKFMKQKIRPGRVSGRPNRDSENDLAMHILCSNF